MFFARKHPLFKKSCFFQPFLPVANMATVLRETLVLLGLSTQFKNWCIIWSPCKLKQILGEGVSGCFVIFNRSCDFDTLALLLLPEDSIVLNKVWGSSEGRDKHHHMTWGNAKRWSIHTRSVINTKNKFLSQVNRGHDRWLLTPPAHHPVPHLQTHNLFPWGIRTVN